MESFNRWFLNDTIYRTSLGKPFEHTFSCGFMSKSGWTEDVTDQYSDRFAMIYLLNGSGTYSDSHGHRLTLRAGDVFFRRPDRRHTTEVDPDSAWHECFVSVRSHWHELFRSMDLIPTGQSCFTLGPVPYLPEMTASFLQRLRSTDTPSENAQVEFDIAALMQWTLSRVREDSQADLPRRELLRTARERIRQRACEHEGLETVLAGTGLSYSRLRGLFRQAYGISPGEYRVQVRIEQACALLEATALSIKEIADRLGYSDAFAFSKQFKQHVGVSPTLFRQRRGGT
ncbi:AraC family transcriptional regulator [Ruficoccus sp. ZRK36]|uniref:helix-turn-helix domain-containing protein n=1 Tax=Ruficoccus sp. ZRK36 TaxID=2866311 RepID=UPI001C73791F|nr:AraC family transcriptional regulator [Ruficoccus sp. ZRK36]QYY36910.1 AraC family transcriptional regulator [Ruficoccus sp. ZRK36]